MNFRPNLLSEKKIWSDWWSSQSILLRVLPLILVIAYWLTMKFFNVLRLDHYGFGFIGLFLWYLGPRVRPFFKFILPLLLVAVIYDSQRIYSDLIRGPIHVKE